MVRLRAYYWAPDEKLLITDFIPNGNLASALKGRPGQPTLSWSTRLRIAKGTAHGLAYLHDCSPRKFVHGHVKPSNILLDGEFNPYVSDFGLFRLVHVSGSADSVSSSSSLGFIGAALPTTKPGPIQRPNNYQAPEARGLGARPTQKWDVYSFGLVLLELLTGKTAEMSSAATTSSSPADPVPELAKWVRKGFDGTTPLSEMIDPALHHEVHAKKEVLSVFHVALACTEADPELRPRMKTVSDNLDRVGHY